MLVVFWNNWGCKYWLAGPALLRWGGLTKFEIMYPFMDCIYTNLIVHLTKGCHLHVTYAVTFVWPYDFFLSGIYRQQKRTGRSSETARKRIHCIPRLCTRSKTFFIDSRFSVRYGSCDGSVGIATGPGADRSNLRITEGARVIAVLPKDKTDFGAHLTFFFFSWRIWIFRCA